jgi:hypothetical protein
MHTGLRIADGAGPAAVHRQIHEAAVGKTVEAVYLGEVKLDEPYEAGGNDRTEYLLLEFTDGSTLPLQIAAGNTFWVGYDVGAQVRR